MSDPTTERLQAIQSELAGILEERLSALNEAMRGTEALTRRIVSAELEIERHASRRESLEAEVGELEAAAKADLEGSAGMRARHAELVAERQAIASETERLEEEVTEAGRELERTRGRVTQLEAEAEALRSENANEKAKLKTLEENIARMRRLKEELMSSISGLTQQMTGLAGGSD